MTAREPITKSGKRLLNWADSDMSDINPSNFDTVAQAVIDIENELLTTSYSAATLLQLGLSNINPSDRELVHLLEMTRVAGALRDMFGWASPEADARDWFLAATGFVRSYEKVT